VAFAAEAQQPAMLVIGYIDAGSPEPAAHLVAAFLRGLGETGFVESRNVAIEFRWAHNNNERLPELAADLVRRRVAVIVAPQSTAAVMEAKAATRTIPIVFGTGSDPVQAGLVTSLNRPDDPRKRRHCSAWRSSAVYTELCRSLGALPVPNAGTVAGINSRRM
jgi:putative tryptophan/tyrosine transport system substrate-binding protein